MRRAKFGFFETFLIALMLLLFLLATALYITNIPILQYVLGWQIDVKQERVGDIGTLSGNGRRESLGDGEFLTLKPSSALYNYDTVVTGPNSSATIKLDNGGKIELGPDTMVRLEFDSRLSLNGISRDANVNIIAGNVSGENNGAGALFLKSRDGVVPLLLGSKKSIQVAQAPLVKPPGLNAGNASSIDTLKTAPVAPIVAAVASPSPSPSMVEAKVSPGSLLIVYPKSNEVLAVTPGNQRPDVPITFKWKINPAAQVKAVVRRLTGVKSEGDSIFSEDIESPGGKGSAKIVAESPGNYEFEIRGSRDSGDGKEKAKNAKVRFSIAARFIGIETETPLVGGTETGSNQLSEKLINDFNITLRWKPYPEAKGYHVRLAKSANSPKAMLEKDVDDPEYSFNKDKVIAGRVYWTISAKLSNGFIPESKTQLFVFDFLPPTLMVPENNAQISRGDPRSNTNTILFTWRKTNFTESYDLEVAEDPKFTKTILNKRLKENFYILKNPVLGTFWWRVKSNAKDYSSPSSPPFSFNVKASGS